MSRAPKRGGLRAYARHRGVALRAVQKAIASSRLVESVTRDAKGRAKSIDFVRADLEWSANTDPALAPLGGAGPASSNPFQTARAEKESTRAAIDALKLAKMRGDLVDAGEVKRALVDVFTKCRTKLLGVTSRARQQLPHLSAADVTILEGLVREALEDLAGEGVRP